LRSPASASFKPNFLADPADLSPTTDEFQPFGESKKRNPKKVQLHERNPT
jgi:hypothetical protein